MKKYIDERIRIGNKIREIRKQKKISQVELADITGLNQTQISRIENGTYSCSIDALCHIAEHLDMTVELVPIHEELSR